MKDLRIGVGITGAFGAFSEVLPLLRRLAEKNDVTAVMSKAAATWDTRFYKAEDFLSGVARATGKPPVTSIVEAEQLGRRSLFDVMLIAPCTGNTLAKIDCGITDTAVTMAARSHLLLSRPLVIALSTGDGLGADAINIGGLSSRRNVYFVPYAQEEYDALPHALTARFGLCDSAIECALRGEQVQPMLV